MGHSKKKKGESDFSSNTTNFKNKNEADSFKLEGGKSRTAKGKIQKL